MFGNGKYKHRQGLRHSPLKIIKNWFLINISLDTLENFSLIVLGNNVIPPSFKLSRKSCN
uniref:Uncharacterized protein n=1 Tax=Rhizophora mucronata TaxID=61149 RepID=A0A2P2QU73_RHIMU